MRGLWYIMPEFLREIFEAPYRRDARIEVDRLLKDIADKKLSVLDAGAGDGFAKKWFRGHDYTALDAQNYGFNTVGNIERMDFANNSFDLVLCLEVLEYVLNPSAALKEIHRILKKGGRVIMSTPLLTAGYHGDRQRWSPPGLRALFEEAGLNINLLKPIGGYFRMLGWQISKLSYKVKKPKNKFLLPFYYLVKIPVGIIFQILIPLFLFSLDFFDKEKKDTCGYVVVASK